MGCAAVGFGVAVGVTFCGVRVFRRVAVGVGFCVYVCVSNVNECKFMWVWGVWQWVLGICRVWCVAVGVTLYVGGGCGSVCEFLWGWDMWQWC